MPNYDYVCDECGHHFEHFQKMTDDPLEVCPRCNGKVKRLIGAGAGLIFKGSGFYITDYKNSKTTPPNKSVKPKKKAEKKKSKESSTKSVEKGN